MLRHKRINSRASCTGILLTGTSVLKSFDSRCAGAKNLRIPTLECYDKNGTLTCGALNG